MIKKIKRLIETQTTLLKKKAGIFKEEDVECFIDEEEVKCDALEAPAFECGPGHFTQGYGWFGGTTGYVGTVPAPKVLSEDSWFGPPPMSSKQVTIVNEQLFQEQMQYNSVSSEPNIHQISYEMATRSGSTTLQLDPIGGSENFQGGSENYHERNCK
tara:strand:+ start:264 stop:734 length:471 start_codon:yes stop_codon:yes gene_type:complete